MKSWHFLSPMMRFLIRFFKKRGCAEALWTPNHVRGGTLDPQPSARRHFGPSTKCAEGIWTLPLPQKNTDNMKHSKIELADFVKVIS